MDTLGQKLKKIRLEKGKTQFQVDVATTIPGPYLSNFENDRRRPSKEMLKILANFYGLTVEELLDGVYIEEMGVRWKVVEEEEDGE